MRTGPSPASADLGGLRAALAGHGFDDIGVLDISWNLAPSIAHIPLFTTRFLVAESILRRGRLARSAGDTVAGCA